MILHPFIKAGKILRLEAKDGDMCEIIFFIVSLAPGRSSSLLVLLLRLLMAGTGVTGVMVVG